MERIGPYEIRGELGAGGMGVVYRARRDGAETDVALKVITAGSDASAEAIARFQREARIAGELDHPGIVRVLESGSDAGIGWFAMELVDGEPLSHAIREREFTWREAVGLVRDVANALAAAHRRGVLHRDLKPSNILLDAGGAPRIADFGLAKDTRTGSKYTRTGQTLGTPAYMSPEQARGDLADLTPAGDVWALGCILYELLANRQAFEGETPAAVVGAVLTTTPDAPAAVPAPVTELLFAALARDPVRRPSDAAVFAAECERVLRGERPVHRPARPVPVAAVAGVAAAAVLVVIWSAWPASAPPSAPDPQAVARAAAQADADAAWALRRNDPASAMSRLAQACERLPLDDPWRVRLGVLRWARDGTKAAIAEWDRVPSGSAGAARARWLTGLAAVAATSVHSDAALDDRPRPAWEAAAAAGGPAARWAEAALAMLDERWGRARELLGEPREWDAALLRGYVETRMGAGKRDAAAGARAYSTALERGIPMAWVHVNRGSMRNDLGDTAGALEDYDAALRLDPGHRVARLNRALHLHRAGHTDEALAEFDRLLATHPDYTDGYRRRAGVRLAAGDRRGAVRDYSRVLSVLPGDVTSLVNRAIARGEAGDRTGALADYGAALHADPGNVLALFNRGIVHHQQRAWAAAERDFRAALEAQPRYWKAQLWLGKLAQQRGDHAAALKWFDAVVELNRAHAITFVSRGRSKDLLQDTAGAMADFAQALAIDAANPGTVSSDAHAFRAMLHQRLGDLDAALADYTRALELQPSRPPALLNRALILSARGRKDDALRDLDAALALQPAFLPARVSRAALLMGRQELAKATADLEYVLARAPEGSQVRAIAERNLAKIRRAQGR